MSILALITLAVIENALLVEYGRRHNWPPLAYPVGWLLLAAINANIIHVVFGGLK